MSNVTTGSDSVQTIMFCADVLVANAKLYAANKRLVDAASQYDNLDDAIASLRRVWDVLESQIRDGGVYTPSTELGFGSDNASQIAAAILGRKTSVVEVRKAFQKLGK